MSAGRELRRNYVGRFGAVGESEIVFVVIFKGCVGGLRRVNSFPGAPSLAHFVERHGET